MELFIIDPLKCKLGQFAALSDEDRRVLDELSGEGVRTYAAREDIEQEGSKPTDVKLVLAGWACRYKLLADGRRQIMAFLLPGDISELHVHLLSKLDHSICALTPALVARISSASLTSVMGRHPRIAEALLWAQLVAAATQREWIINLGQRSAFERVAHLLCELFIRMQGIGLVQDRRCEFPLTQAELADATGLSAIHVNRTLQELRGKGLIALRSRGLYIPDLADLQDAAEFNPDYLHLRRQPTRKNLI